VSSAQAMDPCKGEVDDSTSAALEKSTSAEDVTATEACSMSPSHEKNGTLTLKDAVSSELPKEDREVAVEQSPTALVEPISSETKVLPPPNGGAFEAPEDETECHKVIKEILAPEDEVNATDLVAAEDVVNTAMDEVVESTPPDISNDLAVPMTMMESPAPENEMEVTPKSLELEELAKEATEVPPLLSFPEEEAVVCGPEAADVEPAMAPPPSEVMESERANAPASPEVNDDAMLGVNLAMDVPEDEMEHAPIFTDTGDDNLLNSPPIPTVSDEDVVEQDVDLEPNEMEHTPIEELNSPGSLPLTIEADNKPALTTKSQEEEMIGNPAVEVHTEAVVSAPSVAPSEDATESLPVWEMDADPAVAADNDPVVFSAIPDVDPMERTAPLQVNGDSVLPEVSTVLKEDATVPLPPVEVEREAADQLLPTEESAMESFPALEVADCPLVDGAVALEVNGAPEVPALSTALREDAVYPSLTLEKVGEPLISVLTTASKEDEREDTKTLEAHGETVVPALPAFLEKDVSGFSPALEAESEPANPSPSSPPSALDVSVAENSTERTHVTAEAPAEEVEATTLAKVADEDVVPGVESKELSPAIEAENAPLNLSFEPLESALEDAPISTESTLPTLPASLLHEMESTPLVVEVDASDPIPAAIDSVAKVAEIELERTQASEPILECNEVLSSISFTVHTSNQQASVPSVTDADVMQDTNPTLNDDMTLLNGMDNEGDRKPQKPTSQSFNFEAGTVAPHADFISQQSAQIKLNKQREREARMSLSCPAKPTVSPNLFSGENEAGMVPPYESFVAHQSAQIKASKQKEVEARQSLASPVREGSVSAILLDDLPLAPYVDFVMQQSAQIKANRAKECEARQSLHAPLNVSVILPASCEGRGTVNPLSPYSDFVAQQSALIKENKEKEMATRNNLSLAAPSMTGSDIHTAELRALDQQYKQKEKEARELLSSHRNTSVDLPSAMATELKRLQDEEKEKKKAAEEFAASYRTISPSCGDAISYGC
jgi:hypothetical protein